MVLEGFANRWRHHLRPATIKGLEEERIDPDTVESVEGFVT